MHVLYAREPFNNIRPRSLFLAGPTPRTPDVPSWRKDALEILSREDLDATIFIPEDREGTWKEEFNYDDQIAWEEEGLTKATCIVFWIPRDLKTLPGMTTNIEFGVWMKSGKVVLGAPLNAPKMKYFYYYAKKLGIPTAHTLEETLTLGIASMKA